MTLAAGTEMVIDRSAFIVVPAYNEARVIRQVVADLCRLGATVVVVDDGSTDGTAAELAGLDAVLVRHAVNLGQGAALQTGITYALSRGARWVVTFDADGQHRVADIEPLLEHLAASGCDAVLGSRFLGRAVNMPWHRKLLLKVAVAFGRLLAGHRLTDAHNGLRALTRRAAEALEITQNGMAHASELVSQLRTAGLTLQEHPVTIEYTRYSLAKGQSGLNSVNIAIDLLLARIKR